MPAETFTIKSRFLVSGQGWTTEVVEHTGTMQDAWKQASQLARALDDTYGDSHFWTVDLKGDYGSIVQLFHGRLV